MRKTENVKETLKGTSLIGTTLRNLATLYSIRNGKACDVHEEGYTIGGVVDRTTHPTP